MKWFPFFILAYVALGIQFGLSGYAMVWQARPNFVLVAVIFVAMNATRNSALIGCLLLGLMQDAITQQAPPGLAAFSYGAIAILIINTREVVDRDHFLTHISLAILGGLIYAVIAALHGWLYYGYIRANLKPMRPAGGPLFVGALYSGILAPLVMMLLRRTKRTFGFRPARTHV